MKKNNKKSHNFWLFCCCFLLASCSNGGYRYNQSKLYKYYQNNDLKKAEKLVKKNKFLPENNNILLKTIEKGTAYYYNKKYCNAIQEFDKAGEIIKEQQTKSISSAITSAVGANEGIFYGETFEKSLINFYKSLTNYQIYSQGYCEEIENKQNGKNIYNNTNKNKDNHTIIDGKIYLTNNEKQNYLKSARANVLYWDSWIKSRIVAEDDKFYIEDALLKMWGAFIHEQIGGNFELQIAKQLYEDAKNIATTRYPVYKTFNKHNKNFVKNIADKYKRQSFIDTQNIYVLNLVKYCDEQIQRLKKKIKSNLTIVIHDGNVSLKKIKKKKTSTKVLLASASTSVLGILSLLSLVDTTYEEPYISKSNINYQYIYEIKNKDKILLTKNIILNEPISDINYMNLQEKVNGIITKLLAGLTAKYIAVLTPIAATYVIAAKSNSAWIQLAAVATAIATYKISASLIEQSAMVDIRQWVSLPSNIFLATDHIKNGKYTLSIFKKQNDINIQTSQVNDKINEKKVYEKEIEITDQMTFIDLKIV